MYFIVFIDFVTSLLVNCFLVRLYRFQRVIAQSCLSRDLMFLPLQELTVIGSKSNINITVELAAKISIAR